MKKHITLAERMGWSSLADGIKTLLLSGMTHAQIAAKISQKTKKKITSKQVEMFEWKNL